MRNCNCIAVFLFVCNLNRNIKDTLSFIPCQTNQQQPQAVESSHLLQNEILEVWLRVSLHYRTSPTPLYYQRSIKDKMK